MPSSNDETRAPDDPPPQKPRTSRRPADPTLAPGKASAHSSSSKDPPPNFGNYRIRANAILGEGGMGVVYIAEQVNPKRPVALKVIRPMLGTRAMLQRFQREADVLGRLEHPGIARIYDAGSVVTSAGPQPYFAMELVHGRPLLEHVESQQLTTKAKLELLALICDAVEYAHQHGVIHRDLKPSNILVEKSGAPKILDFGVARVTDSDVPNLTMETNSGALVGTVQYMSPEQAAGDTRGIDARSDVYALGLIAYEMLAGRYPFDLSNKPIYEAVRIVREEEPPGLASISRALRGDIDTIIRKAIEKQKTRRYSSAAEFARDIRAYLAHRPITARPPSFSYVASKFVRRNRLLLSAVTGALLIIVLGVAWTISGRRASEMSQLNLLTRRFDEELRKTDWSDASVTSLDGTIGQLSGLSPSDAKAAQARLNQAYAERLNIAIHQPVVRPEDARRIGDQLDYLAKHDATAADKLRQALRSRSSSLEQALHLTAGNFSSANGPAAMLFKPADAKNLMFVAPQKYRPGSEVVQLGIPCGANTRAEMTVGGDWETLPSEIGFAFIPTMMRRSASQPVDPSLINLVDDRAADGYTLLMDVEYLDSSGQVPSAAARNVADAREADGALLLSIRRKTRTIRTMQWPLSAIPSGPLRLAAWREGGRLGIQVNSLPPVEAFDSFPPPLAGASVAVKLPNQIQLEHLTISRRPLPAVPHPLNEADDRYAAGAYADALSRYESVAVSEPVAEVRSEARFKEALCLDRLSRTEEAIKTLDELLQGPSGRWSAAAGCSLWTIYLKAGRRTQAQEVIDLLSARYEMRELAELLPDDMRRTLEGIYVNDFNSVNLLRDPDPKKIERLRQASQLEELFNPAVTLMYLTRAYESAGDFDSARKTSERLMEKSTLFSWRSALAIQAYSTLMRKLGEPQRALDAVHRFLIDQNGDARPQFWSLVVERARLLQAMGDYDQAERDLLMFLKYRQDKTTFAHLADASLLLGFLRERRGDLADAKEAWSAGRLREHLQFTRTFSGSARSAARSLSTADAFSAQALGCLSGDMTDEEIQDMVAVGDFSNNESFDIFKRGGYTVPTSIIRAVFADPRGIEWARRLAMRADPPAQQLRSYYIQVLREFFAAGTVGAHRAPEQDEMLDRAARACEQTYRHGHVDPSQLLKFAFAWKGLSDQLGWAGLHDVLEPEVKGPLGWVVAERFKRLGQEEASQEIRKRAMQEMSASGAASQPTTLAATSQPTTTRATTLPANIHVDVPDLRPPRVGRKPTAITQVAVKPDLKLQPAPQKPAVAVAARPPTAKHAPALALEDELNQINGQAWLLRRDGKLDEALTLRKQVVEKARAGFPEGDPRTFKFMVDAVELQLETKKYDDATRALQAAADFAAADATQTASVRKLSDRLAYLRRSESKSVPTTLAATLPVSRPASAPVVAIAPAAPPKAASPATKSTDNLDLRFVTEMINGKQYHDAEMRLLDLYARALDMPPDEQRDRRILIELSHVYDSWGMADKAKLYRARSAAQAQSRTPDQAFEQLDLVNKAAFMLRQAKELRAAEQLRRRVVAEAKQHLQPGDARLLQFQIDYVDLLLEMNQYAPAETELLLALKSAPTAADNKLTARIKRSLARMYDLWGKPDQADQYRQAASRPTTQAASPG